LKLSERLRNFGKKKSDIPEESEEEEKAEVDNTIHRKPSQKLDPGPPPPTHIPELETKKSFSKLEKKSSQAKIQAKRPKNPDEEYKKWFRLPDTEIVLKTFTCANKSTITQQGTLYLSQSYICFSANVFGRRTKDKFPFYSITSITLASRRIEIELKEKNDNF